MTSTCFCGAVSVTIDRKPDFIFDCNCSLCRKSGGAWGYFPPASLSTSGPTTSFARTDKALAAVEVHACSTCASTTHWVRTDAFKREHGTDDMVGVNMRLFDPDELSGIEVQFPDGKNWDGNGAFGFQRDAIAIGEDTRW